MWLGGRNFCFADKNLTLSYLVGKIKIAVCLEHIHKRFFHPGLRATRPGANKIQNKMSKSALKYSAEARKY